MRYERRILVLSLMAGLAGSAVSLLMIWSLDFTLRTQLPLTLLIVLWWLGFAVSVKTKVAFPLRTLSNMLGALREGDYSSRIRGGESGHEGSWREAALIYHGSPPVCRAIEVSAVLSHSRR